MCINLPCDLPSWLAPRARGETEVVIVVAVMRVVFYLHLRPRLRILTRTPLSCCDATGRCGAALAA